MDGGAIEGIPAVGIRARTRSSGVAPVSTSATVVGSIRAAFATKNGIIKAKHQKDNEEKMSFEKLRSKNERHCAASRS